MLVGLHQILQTVSVVGHVVLLAQGCYDVEAEPQLCLQRGVQIRQCGIKVQTEAEERTSTDQPELNREPRERVHTLQYLWQPLQRWAVPWRWKPKPLNPCIDRVFTYLEAQGS